jgi:hypothetical protein
MAGADPEQLMEVGLGRSTHDLQLKEIKSAVDLTEQHLFATASRR